MPSETGGSERGAAVELRRLGADQARAIRETLADIYERAYADKLDGAFRSRGRFLERLDAHLERDGTELVAAHTGNELVGYIYGFPLPAATGWWKGFEGELPPEVAQATAEERVRAVAELMVVPERRRQGIAEQLHDALLEGWRDEGIATMLVDPANTPARSAYVSWGWELLGHLKPFQDSPRFESRIKSLD